MPVMEYFDLPATARLICVLQHRAEIDALAAAFADGAQGTSLMDLRELYQDIIVDHNRSPRNFRVPEHFDRMADGFNPLCGDKLHVYLTLDEIVISDIGFQGIRVRDIGRLRVTDDRGGEGA